MDNEWKISETVVPNISNEGREKEDINKIRMILATDRKLRFFMRDKSNGNEWKREVVTKRIGRKGTRNRGNSCISTA